MAQCTAHQSRNAAGNKKQRMTAETKRGNQGKGGQPDGRQSVNVKSVHLLAGGLTAPLSLVQDPAIGENTQVPEIGNKRT